MRVGVIGAGFMGAIHAQVYRDLPQTELVAVTDLDTARARRAAGGDDCAVFTDYREMFARSALDVVSICTKDDLHREPALAAAAAGVHIMLEKPIAATLEDAVVISKAAQEAGVRLGVGYLLRFDPRYALARQALEDGRLGELTHVTAKRSSPHTEGPSRYGGSLPLALHVTVHDLDLIYWLTGKKVRRVYAQAATKLLGGSGTEDSVFAILTLEDGVVANLESSWALPGTSKTKLDARLALLGTRGLAEVDCGESGLYLADEAGVDYPDTQHWPTIGGRVRGDIKEELAGFIEDVRTGSASVADGEAATESLKVALAIIESSRAGTVISL